MIEQPEAIVKPVTPPVNDPNMSWSAWSKQPSPANAGKMLQSLKPTLDKGLRQFAGASASSPIMRSHAKLLALNAARGYNPAQGDIRTHVMSHLQRLQRLNAASSLTRLPDQLSSDFQRLSQHEAEFRDKYGRDPSDGETTDLTGLSPKRLEKIRGAKIPIAEGQLVGEQSNSDKYEKSSEKAWVDYLYHDMSPTDQVIMDYTLGRNGSPVLQVGQIAKRLGITAGAVSQRTAKLQQLIDSRHELSPF